MPAYNEEAMLENTVNDLKVAMQTIDLNGEIVVTDNNSTDRTAESLKMQAPMLCLNLSINTDYYYLHFHFCYPFQMNVYLLI